MPGWDRVQWTIWLVGMGCSIAAAIGALVLGWHVVTHDACPLGECRMRPLDLIDIAGLVG